ncbi:MAG TPA: RagB/SusD family nutrient uptake outer membrane protein [Gemmatimonadaceae bacterium]|nr:RagB/SusD family nutrient uptake outer membrane protein [Gemmatimonadaceae bacterium]
MRQRLAVLGLATVVALAGCIDLTEEVVTGVTGAYFATPAGADAAVTGAYNRLRNFYGQEREVAMTMLGTDSWEKGGELGADSYWNDYTSQLSPSAGGNNHLLNWWQNSYQAIDAANTAIFFIEGSSQIPEATKNIRLGEARFLRALYYFNLVRTYGDVHLLLVPTTGVAIQASRTPAAQIYSEVIVPDLTFAIANLPATQPQFGRATKGAAQMLLAEAYLTRAATGDFALARDLTTAVIGNTQYRLKPDYRSLFCGPERVRAACDFVPANETDPEFIFSVQFTGDESADQFGNSLHLYYTMAYDLGGVAVPTLARTVEYGRPFRRLRPTLHLLRIYNRADDSRYDATFQTLWQQPNGDTAIYFPGTPVADKTGQGKKYGESEYTAVLFPTVKKWLDQTRANPATFAGKRDRHLWRLADAYLLRAEANIRSGDVAAAIPDFNMLRRRAAKPGHEAANELSTAELAQLNASPIDFLLDERERELAAEEFRWWTLTRLGKLVDRVQKFNPGGGANIKPFHVLRPIPQTQIDRTEGGIESFPQNPGY